MAYDYNLHQLMENPMATAKKFVPFEKSKKDSEKKSYGKEGSKKEEAKDKRQATAKKKK
jgi:hypothetical protein